MQKGIPIVQLMKYHNQDLLQLQIIRHIPHQQREDH